MNADRKWAEATTAALMSNDDEALERLKEEFNRCLDTESNRWWLDTMSDTMREKILGPSCHIADPHDGLARAERIDQMADDWIKLTLPNHRPGWFRRDRISAIRDGCIIVDGMEIDVQESEFTIANILDIPIRAPSAEEC